LEQPKKPGPRDITDLKARLGLNRGPAVGGPPPAARAPFPGAPGGGMPAPPPQPFPPQGGSGFPAGGAPPPAMGGGYAPQAPAPDPYASMRPPPGRQFDLRPVDDGVPIESVKRGGFSFALLVALGGAVAGAVLGVGFGMAMSGRRAYNITNSAAKSVKSEVDKMHASVSQIGQAVAMSQQRAAAAKVDRLAFDPKLIEDLEKVPVDPRPDTSRIFRVDYFRMSDLAVDNLMSYYYDTIALYGEVERFVKKSKADKDSLASFAAKQAKEGGTKYGIVFAGGGKIVVANLVEMRNPVCKGGGTDCAMDQLEGFEIRANSGANWATRPVGSKPDGKIMVPLEPTPLLESVMAGSPDQARMEQYRIRYANIQLLLTRLAQVQKQLKDALDTAAKRQDIFAL
jgi:hypothetical protein